MDLTIPWEDYRTWDTKHNNEKFIMRNKATHLHLTTTLMNNRALLVGYVHKVQPALVVNSMEWNVGGGILPLRWLRTCRPTSTAMHSVHLHSSNSRKTAIFSTKTSGKSQCGQRYATSMSIHSLVMFIRKLLLLSWLPEIWIGTPTSRLVPLAREFNRGC